MKLLAFFAALFFSAICSAESHLIETRIAAPEGDFYTLASSPQPLSEFGQIDFEEVRRNFDDVKVQVIVGSPSQISDANAVLNDLQLPSNISGEVFSVTTDDSEPAESSAAARNYKQFNRTENLMFATVMTAYMSAATFSVWIFAKDADPQTAATMAALYSTPVFYMTFGLRTFDRLFRKAAEKLKLGALQARETGVRMGSNLFHAEMYLLWMYLFAEGAALTSASVQGNALLNVLTTSIGAAYLDSIRTKYFKSSSSKWFNFSVFALLSPLILADLSGIHFLEFELLQSDIAIPTLGVVVSAQITAAQLLQRSKKFRRAVRKFTVSEHRAFKKFFRSTKRTCSNLLSAASEKATAVLDAVAPAQ